VSAAPAILGRASCKSAGRRKTSKPSAAGMIRNPMAAEGKEAAKLGFILGA